MYDLIDLNTNTAEEIPKNYIHVIFEDKESRVSWYADTSIEDARFAITCACDSLVDSEFEVLDDKAKVVDLNKIQSFKTGAVFFLRRKSNNRPTNILLDGKRKLFVEIEALRHIESQVAVKYMIIGSNLLKHRSMGLPHIRFFQLSSDLKRILWYTKSKKIDEAQVSIDSIKEIIIGQHSENFMKYPLKMLENFSFSIYYYKSDDKTLHSLDLTCKDEREFDLWLIGIKALYSHFSGKVINKDNLLSHSRCYKEQIENGNIGSCSKFLFYNQIQRDTNKENRMKSKSNKSLENIIASRNLSQYDMAKLFEKLCGKIKFYRDEVEQLSVSEDYSTGKKDQGYDMIFSEEAIVDDLDTQRNQMIVLFKDSEKILSIILQQFLWYTDEHKLNSQYNIHEDDMDDFLKTLEKLELHLNTHLKKNDFFDSDSINPEFLMRELDIQLWKVEIDLENVGDIINRFKTPQNSNVIETIKNFFNIFKRK